MYRKILAGADEGPGSRGAISVVIAGARCTCAAEAQRALVEQHGIRVLANATTRDGAAAAVVTLQPDVAIVDAALLSMSEHFLAGWGPVSQAARFVVVGRDEQGGCARRLMAQGVAAYVPASDIVGP